MLREAHAIEAKQAGRWQDLQRNIATPLMDQVLALGPNDIPNRQAWKRLLRIAAFLDTHLQRTGSESDIPNTRRAYLDGFEGLLAEYRRG